MHKVTIAFNRTQDFEIAGELLRKMIKDTAGIHDYQALQKIFSGNEPKITYRRDTRRGGYGSKEQTCVCGHKRSDHFDKHGQCLCVPKSGEGSIFNGCTCRRYVRSAGSLV